jgi:hypothetical protein
MQLATNTRRVYQAGYTSHYGWHTCGYGLTLEEARADLKIKIEEQALQRVVSVCRALEKDGYPDPDLEGLRRCYLEAIEYHADGCGYLETHYDERVGDQ